ncbi:TPA: rubrerythrin family protein, partial [Candidatus Bathyarchaeota archaeon]|nr:rubrerythrin family protein [Candidatus Bathyarchaeota archaeon]
MAKTDENLKSAFAGESQANRRYLAFAKKAEEEGFTQASKLFKAAAEAETIHALNHVRISGEVKSTMDNLNAAVSGETHEFKKMYPEFISVAK